MSSQLLVSLRNTLVLGIFFFASIFAWALSCFDVVQVQKRMLDFPTQESKVKFKVIADPQSALAATVKMIREAKGSLDISTFIIRNDETGQIMISELSQAALRGVSIRLLVDSLGSLRAAHGDLKTLLKFPQVQIATFNSITHWKRYPKSLTSWLKESFGFHVSDRSADKFFLSRLHDKIMIADRGSPDMMIMVGGRNFSDIYFGIGKFQNSPMTFLDMNVLIKPETFNDSFTKDLDYYFESLFFHQTNQILTDSRFGLFNSEKAQVDRMKTALENNQWLETMLDQMQTNGFMNQNFEAATLKFVHELQNITRSRNLFNFATFNWKSLVNKNSVALSLREAIKSAKEHVRIVTPYLILSLQDIQQLKTALLKNPELKIEFFTNSNRSTNQMSSQLIFEAIVLPKLIELLEHPQIKDQLSIYLYHPKQPLDANLKAIQGSLHAKLVEVDGQYLVTSSNFDLISRFSNSELGFWLKPKAQSQDLQNYINLTRENSLLVGSPAWKADQQSAKQKGWRSLKVYLGKFLQWFHIRLLHIG